MLQIISRESHVFLDRIFTAVDECIFLSRFVKDGTVFGGHAHFLELPDNRGKSEIMVDVSLDLDVPDQFFLLFLNPMLIDLVLTLHDNQIDLETIFCCEKSIAYLFDLLVEIWGGRNVSILGVERETIIHKTTAHHVRVGVEESGTEWSIHSIVLVDQILVVFPKSIFFEVSWRI